MMKDKGMSDRDKILRGMDKVYVRLIESKKKTNSDMIVIRNNRIMKIKAD